MLVGVVERCRGLTSPGEGVEIGDPISVFMSRDSMVDAQDATTNNIRKDVSRLAGRAQGRQVIEMFLVPELSLDIFEAIIAALRIRQPVCEPLVVARINRR